MPSSRRKPRASGPSPSPARDRSPSPVAAAGAEGSTDLSGGGVHVGTHPFKLTLELPRTDEPHEPIRHTFCFFRSTSAADLGRAISAAFYGNAEHKDVAAVWEHQDDGAVDAEPLVHTLSGVIAHPELYTGKTFCLTEQVRRSSKPASTLDLICTEPAVEEPRPPPSLVEVLGPLAPHPRRNPAMLLSLTLGAGALLSCDSRWQDRTDDISLDPITYWRLTTSSRVMALMLFVVTVSGQLHSALRDDGARRAFAQLYASLIDRKLLSVVFLGVGVTVCLWTLRVFDTAARLAIVGAAHCVLGVASMLRSMMSMASVSWFEAQAQHLAQSVQKLFLPLLEINDYAAKQVYLHGPPSPILAESLGFLDLPLDYATEPTIRAVRLYPVACQRCSGYSEQMRTEANLKWQDACQRLSPLRSTDFWGQNIDECSAFIEGKATQFAVSFSMTARCFQVNVLIVGGTLAWQGSVRGVLVLLVAVAALRTLPTALVNSLTGLPWRVRVALPLALAVLNVAIFMERVAEDTVRWTAESEPSSMLSLIGAGILGCLGWFVHGCWLV